MLNKLLILWVFFVGFVVYSNECPTLIAPLDNSTNVPLNATISWNSVEGPNAYIISLGTTQGGTDILAPQFVNGTSFTPPMGLPENTLVYVTISLFYFDGPDIVCPGGSFTTETLTEPPECSQMTYPSNFSNNVNPNTYISWDYAYGAIGYIVKIGTTAGDNDIWEDDVENRLSINPNIDLPEETEVFVTIVPYNLIGEAIGCSSQQFTTGTQSNIPECTQMTYPQNGETNVPLTTELQWQAVPGATEYQVSIGTTPNNNDIVDNSTFYTNTTPIVNLEPNKTYFITITPTNESGSALGCSKESFTTSFGCGPYWDIEIADFVTLNPQIEFPDTLSFCENEAPLLVYSTDEADGYRWYRVDEFDNTTLISEESEVNIEENGTYLYEAYNIIENNDGTSLECPTTKQFEVVSSESPVIQEIKAGNFNGNLSLTVIATGNGDYEFAIDNMDGPYSSSNVFNNVEPGDHILYVRDKNGCGIAQEKFNQDLTVEGFPKFFTPNGDTVNDYWQFIQPEQAEEVILVSIRIFDRYGNFLKQISQNSQGWDGTIRGTALPSSTYWFVAVDDSGQQIKGHFTLKR
ncbi:T9SS type B sorting domain-containing protein [Flagellimonas crocea]|uniref:T9SS type B sorting domain-containing protein n=1 Tax=Flagellimonas crocea TaxID=3067311 RepID=UPI00296FD74C|nr:T9SS type B sorting domain-containing protein [Muricauda sp. DH64]